MIQLMTISPLISNIFITLGILLVLILLFFFEKRAINRKEGNVNKWVMLFVYIMNFALLITAIFAVLMIWQINVGFNFNTLWADALNILQASVRQIVITIFIIFIVSFLTKLIKIALANVGKKSGTNQKRKKTIAKLLMSLSRYSLALIGIIIILGTWGVNIMPALAGLGILGVVIGLGAQKFINDLINGFFIIFEQHYDVGDMVEIAGFRGTVIDLGLKTTRIQNFKGDIKIIANGQITSLTNHSKNLSLALVEFGIAYKEDIQKTTEILNLELPKLMDEFSQIIEAPKVMGVIALSNSSVDLRVACKTLNEQHYAVERALRQRIKEILDAHGIEIPFPQVVVHSPKER